MKGIVSLSIILTLVLGLVKCESKDEQTKNNGYSGLNTIGSTPKPDLLSYQQISQNYGNKYQPQHVFFQQQYQPRVLPYNHQPESTKKPFSLSLQHQSTPVAMVIIAQPAYIPVSMLQQGNVAQQLLQYFQGGASQLKYQYVPPSQQTTNQQPQVHLQTQHVPQFIQYQPQQDQIPQYQGPVAQAQTSEFSSHEALPTPQPLVSQHHVVPHHLNQPSTQDGRLSYQSAAQVEFQQPQQLQQVEEQGGDYQGNSDYTKLAQQAAQHFISNGGLNSGSRRAPAIITGLEHFSPEQQEKIKAQLSEQFGSPLKRLNLEQEQEGGKYFNHQVRQRIRSEKFVPSIQVKNGEITQTDMSEGDKM